MLYPPSPETIAVGTFSVALASFAAEVEPVRPQVRWVHSATELTAKKTPNVSQISSATLVDNVAVHKTLEKTRHASPQPIAAVNWSVTMKASVQQMVKWEQRQTATPAPVKQTVDSD